MEPIEGCRTDRGCPLPARPRPDGCDTFDARATRVSFDDRVAPRGGRSTPGEAPNGTRRGAVLRRESAGSSPADADRGHRATRARAPGQRCLRFHALGLQGDGDLAAVPGKRLGSSVERIGRRWGPAGPARAGAGSGPPGPEPGPRRPGAERAGGAQPRGRGPTGGGGRKGGPGSAQPMRRCATARVAAGRRASRASRAACGPSSWIRLGRVAARSALADPARRRGLSTMGRDRSWERRASAEGGAAGSPVSLRARAAGGEAPTALRPVTGNRGDGTRPEKQRRHPVGRPRTTGAEPTGGSERADDVRGSRRRPAFAGPRARCRPVFACRRFRLLPSASRQLHESWARGASRTVVESPTAHAANAPATAIRARIRGSPRLGARGHATGSPARGGAPDPAGAHAVGPRDRVAGEARSRGRCLTGRAGSSERTWQAVCKAAARAEGGGARWPETSTPDLPIPLS